MPVPDEVYQALLDEKTQLESDNQDLRDAIEQATTVFIAMRDERNSLRDERKTDIFRATLKRMFELIDIDNPPPNLANKIGTFVNNLYNAMYT